MMSGKVLHQAVKPSLRFALSLLGLHMLAATVVFMTAMPLLVKLVIVLLIVLSLIYYLARDALLLQPGSWREISLSPDGVSIIARNGSGFLGQVTHNTVVSPYFVVLCVQLEGHRLLTSRVIFPDALDPGVFREFCVRLKFA
jgi:toxin CptA